MKRIITTLLLLITLSVSSQSVVKFRSDRFGMAEKINGEWESFSEWNLLSQPALIVIKDKESVKFYHDGDVLTYDIWDYEHREFEGDRFTSFTTIDGNGKQCVIILSSEKDENGVHWVNMYFYYNSVKLVYSLY